MNYLYIFGTILFTVLGQVIIKWRVVQYGNLPVSIQEKAIFMFKLLIDPYIIIGLVSALLAALSWMAAMTKFEISHAYPFMALNFILVLVLSGIFFNESITLFKVLGVMLIIFGIIVGSQG